MFAQHQNVTEIFLMSFNLFEINVTTFAETILKKKFIMQKKCHVSHSRMDELYRGQVNL